MIILFSFYDSPKYPYYSRIIPLCYFMSIIPGENASII